MLAVNQSQPGSQYQLLQKDAETLDDDALLALIYRVPNSLHSLDSGGKAFIQLCSSSDFLQAMKSWLYVLEVWAATAVPPYLTSTTLDRQRLNGCVQRS
jgi:hypothetical protein